MSDNKEVAVLEKPDAERFKSEIFIKGARANNLKNIDF